MTSTQLTTPRAAPPARAGVCRARAGRAGGAAIRQELWPSADRVATALVVAFGLVLIAIAWIGASGTTNWDSQLRWTALSIVGVIVVCVGVGVWLFRGFARVRSEACTVRRELARRIATKAAPIEGGDDRARVTAAGMAHHHRANCLLLKGKTVVAADESSLQPCGVCA